MTTENGENSRAVVKLPFVFYLIKWGILGIVAVISIIYSKENIFAQYVTAVLFLSTVLLDASAASYYAYHSEKRKFIKCITYILTAVVVGGIILFLILAFDEGYSKLINIKLSIYFEILILIVCSSASILAECLMLKPEAVEKEEDDSASPTSPTYPISPMPPDGNEVPNSKGVVGTTIQQGYGDSASPFIGNETTAPKVDNGKSETVRNTSGTPPSSS